MAASSTHFQDARTPTRAHLMHLLGESAELEHRLMGTCFQDA